MAFEMSNLRQLPGLAHRPNFPRDLHVLLLDPDFKARHEAEQQLHDNQYSVTPCSCSVEAAAFLANPDNSCDILLADVRCLQQKSAEHAVVVQAAKTIPLVLMSESSAPNEVMLGIKLGAVDFLEKPLSPLKLKNIWQHMVRRLLAANSNGIAPHLKKATAVSGTASPEDSSSQGAGSGTNSHGSGGESGSNASTSDQAPVKLECDAEMETSSLQEALGGCGGFSLDALPLTVCPGPHDTSGAGLAPDSMQLDGMGMGAAGCKLRPQPLKYKASRLSKHGNGTGSSCGPKPCIGYPAGQLPPLPAGIPGVEWGLPTNPLQISPKAPVGGLLGPMSCWPGSPLLAPPMFPSLLALSSPAPSVTSACSTLPLSGSCLALSGAGSVGGVLSGMKRAESAPLPAASTISSASAGTSLCGDGLMQSLGTSARPDSGAGWFDKAELFMGMDVGKPLLPPLGLQLKKSPSLADFISQSLGDSSPAC